MTTAKLHCAFVLLLYLKVSLGQQPLNNLNFAPNNAKLFQQQILQRTANNIHQNPNGGVNINLAQQPNLQQANLQQSPNLSAAKQGNLQQSLNLPSNLQTQSASVPQNNLQITKIEFTPVSSTAVNNPYNAIQLQNTGVKPNVQVIQPQNNPIANAPGSQITNVPVTTLSLANLVAEKGQSSLVSMLNSQNGGQANQQISINTIPAQNQLTDLQKQFLVRSLQSQNSGLNQQGINFVQSQPRITTVENQQAITFRGMQGTPQQAQPIVTQLGNQPQYITVQALPLSNYLQNQPVQPQVTVQEEPSLTSMILSQFGPQYAVNTPFLSPKKGSKTSLKSLIPLIINLLKEKNNCGCRNCGCPNNGCQNNTWPNNMTTGAQMAQIFEGYSNQQTYGQVPEDSPARIKKNDDEEARNNDQERTSNKTTVESEEVSDEDDSEYVDDGEE